MRVDRALLFVPEWLNRLEQIYTNSERRLLQSDLKSEARYVTIFAKFDELSLEVVKIPRSDLPERLTVSVPNPSKKRKHV